MINIGMNIFRVISYAFVIIFALGVLNVHFSDKNDYCIMTYMFEYPQFVRISLPDNKVYPQYGLYAYSEGRATERTRKMWFDGIPVLFLPGNSGSYMQVRSIASVALRKAYSDGYDSHFDYFTVSYNEELSALYGGVLEKQTKFASACIGKILSLYKSNKYTKSVPTSVILIGHSMGGVVAKRLLVYPDTINSTNIALTLAAPLDSPVANVDVAMNNYYIATEYEWHVFKNNCNNTHNKILLSIGNGARDVLVPPGLTTSSDSYINALTTSIPGVWLSPDHVSIVWCKQLVMAINKYLFSIVDVRTQQITDDLELLRSKARQYFQPNRATTLSPTVNRGNVTMLMDAFWYEDNRRMYQISRPGVDRTTYLMVRLVKYPQHRFVAIESVDVNDRDWIFGCNAKYTHNMYRYCQTGTSLSELSRWTGAAMDFGKRKLATVDLHSLMLKHPDWTHVIVRVSPTKKPIILNVDINDYASRRIDVDIDFQTFTKQIVVVQETEPHALYYELALRGFNKLHQAYLLYVEPSAGCSAPAYHVSAELHVPWAENHQYYHYFTQTKRSPMKLRLFKSNPNITMGLEPMEPVKVTLLLDPQCAFTIKLTMSWYHSLAQLARHYTPVLVPYVCAILLLATRATLLHMKEHNTCISLHTALTSESTRPYYILVFARLTIIVLMSIPMLDFLFYNASSKNLELQYFIRSLLVVPAYMTALGILDIAAAAVLLVMVFSSQIAHRLLFRIMWRGGTGLAERVASGLQKVPIVVSSALVCAAPLSCGAASLVAGAAFYGFMLSKMYEEYLEDYVYKLLAKIASRVCGLCKSKDKTERLNKKLAIAEPIATTSSSSDHVTSENKTNGESETCKEKVDLNEGSTENQCDTKDNGSEIKCKSKKRRSQSGDGGDEELNNLNFHMMMFFLWLSVTLINLPALLTWAKSFRYSMVLQPDTSYATGLVMSICSICVWQMNGPRKKLRYYEAVSALIFTMAAFILILGPLSLHIVNYGTTFIFAVITIQQLCDKEDNLDVCVNEIDEAQKSTKTDEKENIEETQKNYEPQQSQSSQKQEGTSESGNEIKDTNDVCDESRIYKMFKNLRDKFSFNEDT